MPTISTLVVAITADTKGLTTGLAQAEGQTAKTTGIMSSFGAVGSLALTGAAVAAIKFGVDSVKAFSEAQAVMAQTEAVMKSTGGAANVTTQDVLDLATHWQNLSGVQDDAIQSSENLLLTFRDVHNEVGKGNDIFNQATGAILDMSTALNRGAIPSADQLQSSTIQLGKALNDPIAGMTALKRVGVSFDESQIATIKHLQESGNLMGAQKIILGELKKEFGGAAKAAGDTFAGQVAKLQANLNNLQEEIGGVLVPRLSLLADVMNDIAQKKMPAASQGVSLFTQSLDDLQGIGSKIAPTLLGWTSALDPLQQALEHHDTIIKLAKGDIENWAGAISNGTLTTDQLRAKLDQMGGSADQVDKIINDVRGTMIGWSKDVAKAADASSGFAHMSVQAFDTWRQESVGDLNGVQASLDDLASKAHLTANAILKAFDKQLKAMADYQENWQKLLARGLPDTLAQQLQEMGLKGAGIVDALANANERKFNQIINDWQKAQRESVETANSIAHIGSAINALPDVTTLDIFIRTHGTGHMPAAQEGGFVERTGVALIHKGETIIPANAGGGGFAGDITLELDGEVLARITRNQLLKLKARNATTGL
jgi:hypothetical protein